MAVRELTLLLKARDEASKTLGDVDAKAGQLGAAAGVMGAAVVAAGVVAAAALFKIGSDFDAAFDTIRVGTGATGKVLEGLKGDMKAAFADVPTDLKSAGVAIADLNTRLGLTGPPLQTMAKQMLELSRISKTDVAENIKLATRVFGDWGVAVEEQGPTLDLLFRASQATGISIGELQAKVVQFGAPLRAMGFSLTESATMLGKWEKEGVNSELVLGSLRIAMGNFARDGVPMRQGLMDTIAEIQKLGPSAGATSLAMKTFGARAGPDMAAAILEGRFAYQDLLAAIEGGSDTIMGVGAETMDAAEKFTLLKNRALTLIEPLASGLFSALGNVTDKLIALGPVLDGFITQLQPVIDIAKQFLAVFLAGDLQALNDLLVKTFGVDITPLIEAFHSLQEVAGKLKDHLQPVLDALGEAIGKFLGNSDNLKAVLAGVAGAIGILIAKAAIAGVIALGIAMWNFAAAVIAATWPIIAIAAAITAAILIWQNWDKIVAFLGEQFERFRSMLSGAFTEALNKIGGVMESVGKAFSEAWDGLKNAVSTGLTNLVTTVQGWIATFLKPFQDAWDGISGAFSTWWASDKGLPGAIKTGLKLLVTTVQGWIEEIKKPFQAAWDAVSSIFSAFLGVGGDLLGALGEGLEALASAVSGWLESFAQVFRDVWDGVTGVFSDFIGVAGSVLGLMGEGLGFLIDAVVGWVTDFKNSFLTVWQAVSDLFGPQLDNLVRLLGVGLQNMVDSVSGWIDTFLQPFREAWTGVMQLFDWFIGRSVVPDALQTGLQNMSTMVDTWGPGFANGFGQVWDDVERTASGAMNALANLDWPVAPKLSDAQIAEIMVGKMPNLKKSMVEGGKGDLSPLQMVQDWWNWPGVREGFGSFQEFAGGKGWLPKAGPGPSVTPSTKVLMDLFEKNYLPGFGTMEEGASAAVQQAAKLLAETTGGKVVASDADMQKWWNTIMSNALNDLLNRDIIGTARPSNPTVPRPSTPSLPPALPSASPRPGAAQTVAITISGVFLSPDRSIAQELARLLKPELDRLVTVGAG